MVARLFGDETWPSPADFAHAKVDPDYYDYVTTGTERMPRTVTLKALPGDNPNRFDFLDEQMDLVEQAFVALGWTAEEFWDRLQYYSEFSVSHLADVAAGRV